jgi:hypothetical protein
LLIWGARRSSVRGGLLLARPAREGFIFGRVLFFWGREEFFWGKKKEFFTFFLMTFRMMRPIAAAAFKFNSPPT